MALFGRKNKQFVRPMAFYKEAALHGDHGKISVSNRKLGLREELVTFVFLGVDTLPKVTPQLVTEIFETAKTHGFIPHFIEKYGHADEHIGQAQALIGGEGAETTDESPFHQPQSARSNQPQSGSAEISLRNDEVWIASQNRQVPFEEAIAKGWLTSTTERVPNGIAPTDIVPPIRTREVDPTSKIAVSKVTEQKTADVGRITDLNLDGGKTASVIELKEERKPMGSVKFRKGEVEYVESFGVGSYNIADIMRCLGFSKQIVCELAHHNSQTCVDPIFLSAPDLVNEFQRFMSNPNPAMKHRVMSSIVFLNEVASNDLSEAYKKKFLGLLDLINAPRSPIPGQELVNLADPDYVAPTEPANTMFQEADQPGDENDKGPVVNEPVILAEAKA